MDEDVQKRRRHVAAERPGGHAQGSTALLARRLEAECARAVDPMQIAALLEADGVTDRLAAEWFDHEDVFALAETLYDEVPLAVEPFEPVQEAGPQVWRDLIRGFLFVLPGLLYFAVLPSLGNPPTPGVLVGGLIFAWVWAQIGGYFGHTLIARKAHRRARTVALGFAGAGSGIAVLFAIVAVATFELEPADASIFVAQGVYLLSASVLLLFRKEHVMLGILLPGAAISAGIVLATSGAGGDLVAAFVALATIISIAGAAVMTTSSFVDISGASLTAKDLRGAVPQGLLALTWAVLVSIAILIPMQSGATSVIGGFIVIPLLLSMGVAEWALRRYLVSTDHALRDTHERYTFAQRALVILATSVALYMAAVSVLSVAVAVVVSQFGTIRWEDIIMLAALGLLGMAFLLGQVLISRLLISVTVGVSMVVTVGATLSLDGVVGSGIGDEGTYLIATAVLASALLIPASMAVRSATTYR